VFGQQKNNLIQKFLMALGENWAGKVTGRYAGDKSVWVLWYWHGIAMAWLP